MLTIDKIEGNSRMGNPVFSHAGKQSNYKILIFQPSYEEKQEILNRFRKEEPLAEQIKEYNEIAGYLTSEKERIKSKIAQIEEAKKKESATIATERGGNSTERGPNRVAGKDKRKMERPKTVGSC